MAKAKAKLKAKAKAAPKPKIALYWAASCGGCEITMTELGMDLVAVSEQVDIVFWPCVMDFKYSDVEAMADKEIDMGQREPDPEKKLAYWAEVQKKIMEDAACKPVVLVKFPFARKAYVKYGYPKLQDSMTVCPIITYKTDIVK